MTDETIDVPAAVLAEHARKQVLLDSEVRVHAPEGAEVDKWDTITEAEVHDVAFEDDDLHVWMENRYTDTDWDEYIRREKR